MTYDQGFDAGERASFKDRRMGIRRERPAQILTSYEVGWWDGYAPRTHAWSSGWIEKPQVVRKETNKMLMWLAKQAKVTA